MARASTLVFAFVTLTAGLLTAQTKSSIEQSQREKLNYFAGMWTVEVHMNIGAFGSRLFLSKEQSEWISNGSLLISRQEGEGDIGGGGLAVLGYDTHKNEYTYHVVKNTGETEDLKGTFEGKTWTWTSDERGSDAERARTRLTMQELSPRDLICCELRLLLTASSGLR